MINPLGVIEPMVGCVTNCYQSMATKLGLLGLMNESLKNSIRSTFKRVTLCLTSFLKSLVKKKMLLKKRIKLSTMCAFKKLNDVLFMN
jgi:hypothetical protein